MKTRRIFFLMTSVRCLLYYQIPKETIKEYTEFKNNHQMNITFWRMRQDTDDKKFLIYYLKITMSNFADNPEYKQKVLLVSCKKSVILQECRDRTRIFERCQKWEASRFYPPKHMTKSLISISWMDEINNLS